MTRFLTEKSSILSITPVFSDYGQGYSKVGYWTSFSGGTISSFIPRQYFWNPLSSSQCPIFPLLQYMVLHIETGYKTWIYFNGKSVSPPGRGSPMRERTKQEPRIQKKTQCTRSSAHLAGRTRRQRRQGTRAGRTRRARAAALTPHEHTKKRPMRKNAGARAGAGA